MNEWMNAEGWAPPWPIHFNCYKFFVQQVCDLLQTVSQYNIQNTTVLQHCLSYCRKQTNKCTNRSTHHMSHPCTPQLAASVTKHSGLLTCDTVSLCDWLAMFKWSAVPSASQQVLHTKCTSLKQFPSCYLLSNKVVCNILLQSYLFHTLCDRSCTRNTNCLGCEPQCCLHH